MMKKAIFAGLGRRKVALTLENDDWKS